MVSQIAGAAIKMRKQNLIREEKHISKSRPQAAHCIYLNKHDWDVQCYLLHFY